MCVPPPGIGQGKLQTAAYQVWSEGNKNACLKTSPLLRAEIPSVKPTLWGMRQRHQGGEQYTDPFLCNSKPAPPSTRSCILGLDAAQTRMTEGDSSSIIPQPRHCSSSCIKVLIILHTIHPAGQTRQKAASPLFYLHSQVLKPFNSKVEMKNHSPAEERTQERGCVGRRVGVGYPEEKALLPQGRSCHLGAVRPLFSARTPGRASWWEGDRGVTPESPPCSGL